LLALSQAVHDLRLGKEMPQVHVVDIRLELFCVRGVDEKVRQITADERLIGADRRQQRRPLVVRVEIAGKTLHRFGFEHRLREIAHAGGAA